MPDPRELFTHRKTGLSLSRLSLGVATQGGLFKPVSLEQSHQVFEAAWAAGLRYFDTAPWYGFGLSELRIGPFLADKSGYVLSSKVGRLLRQGIPPHPSQLDAAGNPVFHTDTPYNVVYDFTYEGAMRSVEESLVRLGLDRLDIAYIHDPDVENVPVDQVVSGAYRALDELRQQGVIRAVGVGMNQWEYPLALAQQADLDLVLLAGRYTLLEQQSLEFMNFCAQCGIGVVIGGVYNSGLLANPRPGAHYNYQAVPSDLLQKALQLRDICQDYGIDLKAAALQFPLAHPAVVSVLCAARNLQQLQQNLTAFAQEIPLALWQQLRRVGLIRGEL